MKEKSVMQNDAEGKTRENCWKDEKQRKDFRKMPALLPVWKKAQGEVKKFVFITIWWFIASLK